MNEDELKKIIRDISDNDNPIINLTSYLIIKKIIELPFDTVTTISSLLTDTIYEDTDISLQVEVNRVVFEVCKSLNIGIEKVEREDRFTGLPFQWNFKKIKANNVNNRFTY